MIKVRYSDTDSLMLRVSGHAGYAERGKDIICAGVTAIVFALLGYLVNIDGTLQYETEESTGYVCIVSNSVDKRVESAFEMALVGLMQLEREHPKYIDLKK